MGTRDVPAKFGGGLTYGPLYARNRSYVLAHGGPFRAILITDNCVIDTALGQGRGSSKPTGRLLFAPITRADDETSTTSFGRFPLPAWEAKLPAGVAELRRCFMVDSRDVAGHVSHRIASLDEELAEDLEVRWNAFAARRGPLASARNSDKLAGLLARLRGDDEPESSEVEAATSTARALTRAWRVEGHDLEAVADAHDQGIQGRLAIDGLESGLRELAELAQAAADALAELTAPDTT